jgi:flagellin
VAADSNYKGTNLLGGTGQELTITFDESGDSTLTVAGVAGRRLELLRHPVPGVQLHWPPVQRPSTPASPTGFGQGYPAHQLHQLSNKLSTVTIRQDFTDKMINTLEDGAANLTNADLNEEGANLLMLQTRQSLGTTSLSMASQAAQSVLRLF